MKFEYVPSRFMLPTSRYSKKLADHAVQFISTLCHTKTSEWAGKPFMLLPWQEQIVRDIFGIVDRQDNTRQFRTVYCEIPKKQGKSEMAAAIALYLLCADGEFGAKIYGCAKDRKQATIVFNVARDMMLLNPALRRLCKYNETQARIVYLPTRSHYTALSGEPGNKQGLNIHGCVFDELLAQTDRRLFDIMTKGAGMARRQPLNFIITTAGEDKTSICWEVHQKAVDIVEGRRIDSTFYPIVFAAPEDSDWTDPEVWKACNPSLGVTTQMKDMLIECANAKENAADEVKFRRDYLCQWLHSEVSWMPMDKYDKCAEPFHRKMLLGWDCYGGLDLSSTDDIAAFVLVFPPQNGHDCYYILPHFWIPKENMLRRVKKDNVMYDKWAREGHLETTEGNIIYYDFIEKKIEELAGEFNILEVAFDEWGAVQMAQNLERQSFKMIKTRQGMKTFSHPTKELYRAVKDEKIRHGGQPVLRWMFENVYVEPDANGNIRPNKQKSGNKIDGAVAAIMAFDRAIRREEHVSPYSYRGMLAVGRNGVEMYDSEKGCYVPYPGDEVMKQRAAAERIAKAQATAAGPPPRVGPPYKAYTGDK
jgi:phage terminase large subunit-like protein